MPTEPFNVGDVVRHPRRPEWGPGTVTRVEAVTTAGRTDQRLWIRFPNAGLKTLLSSVANLESIEAAQGALVSAGDTLADRELRGETGWLASISKRKPEDAMTELPSSASDPFIPVSKRLEFTLSLYRFDDGERLVDWAVAQSGLADPLSRFSRQELEQMYRHWSYERDAHLARLLQDSELRTNPALLRSLLSSASPSARAAAKRLAR